MEKSTINVVIIGHSDAGKSTAAGHLLHKCGRTDKQTIEGYENETDEFGNKCLKYAWFFDRRESERESGMTADISIQSFESSKFKFNIIDTPGRHDLIEKMIMGTSQADVGLLVVDSSQEDFMMENDSNGQTKENCLLAYTLGVKQMIVAINKMDEEIVNFSEERWKIIRGEIAAYLKKIGYKPMKIPFIPISGKDGDNLDFKSARMPWYGGSTLLDALNNVSTPKRSIEKPLRVPIQSIRNTKGVGVSLVGRVETGSLKPGMSIHIAPSNTVGIVNSLRINSQIVTRAIPGEIVSINIGDRYNDLMDIRPGHVLSSCDDCPAKQVSRFEAQVIIMNFPGKISNGYTPIVDCHTSHTQCTFLTIKEKLDQRTGKCLAQNPSEVQTGDVCVVVLEPVIPLCVEQFKDFPPLGRFAVRDMGRTVAVGVVKTTFYGEQNEES